MLEIWKKRALETRMFSRSAAMSGNIMLLCAVLSVWMANFKWGFFCLIVGGLNWFLSSMFGRMADKADAKVKEIESRNGVV